MYGKYREGKYHMSRRNYWLSRNKFTVAGTAVGIAAIAWLAVRAACDVMQLNESRKTNRKLDVIGKELKSIKSRV